MPIADVKLDVISLVQMQESLEGCLQEAVLLIYKVAFGY